MLVKDVASLLSNIQCGLPASELRPDGCKERTKGNFLEF